MLELGPMVEILTSEYGDVPTFTAVPAGDGPWPGVVVLHDAAGLSEDTRGHARWFAAHGYLAAAPDLYRGDRRQLRCMFSTLRDLMTGREAPWSTAIEAARTWLTSHPQCTGKLGLIGFCMGGGFAFMLAPRGLYDAVAPNYGGMNESTFDKLADACPIVASYGAKDRSLRGQAARLEQQLTTFGIPHDVHEYPHAGHGFMNDHASSEVPLLMRMMGALVHAGFDPEAAADARARILAFFAAHLR